MSDVDSLAWFQAEQRVLADVVGMQVIHGVKPPTSGTTASPILRPHTDQLIDLPALILGPVAGDVISARPMRITFEQTAAIYRPRDPIAETWDLLLGDIGRFITAVAARGKAYSATTDIQSLLVNRVDEIEAVEWPNDSNRWYLAQPFVLGLVVEFDVPLTPA